MDRILTFFKHSDSVFGIFYPIRYLLATYPNLEDAKRAIDALRKAGWADDELIAVPGEDVVRYQQEFLLKRGLWGLLLAEFSRFIDTEQPNVDADLEAAKQGAAFIGVHCHTDTVKAEAWKVLAATRPMVARYYTVLGVEHLS